MAMLQTSMTAGDFATAPTSTNGFNEPRGLVTGQSLNFHPDPPARDQLGKPLTVAKLPAHKQPKQTFVRKLSRFLARYNIGSLSAESRLRWKVHDLTVLVLGSLAPVTRTAVAAKGGRAGFRRIAVFHPYHLKAAFDMMLSLPPALSREARYLELVLGLALRGYGDAMTAINNSPFSFEAEAREYFRNGYKAEQLLSKMKGGVEHFSTLQLAYTNFFHGRNYYLYALLRREQMDENTRMFSFFCRASYFMARLNWSGELMDTPNPKQLPSREVLLFHAQRHPAVVERYQSDAAFTEQVNALLKAFPSR